MLINQTPTPRHCERARSGREAIQRYAKQGCSGTCQAWIAAPSATARNDGGVVLKATGQQTLRLPAIGQQALLGF